MKKKDKIVVITLFSIFLFIIIRALFLEYDLKENKAVTEGKIISIYKVGYKSYIKYIYKVHKKWYTDEMHVNSFKCSDGTEGCVGRKFLVYYSKKNFTNSDMHLGIYEKYKRRTRIINYLD